MAQKGGHTLIFTFCVFLVFWFFLAKELFGSLFDSDSQVIREAVVAQDVTKFSKEENRSTICF